MPWNENSSLQLQDMYDRVYSHLIRTLKRQGTMLRILGQVIVAQGLPPDLDTGGSPPNSSSSRWIEAILDLEYGSVMQIVTELRLLLEVEKGDEDIRIRHPSFLKFLLDPIRSRELFVDVNQARLVPRGAPAVVRWIFNTEST